MMLQAAVDQQHQQPSHGPNSQYRQRVHMVTARDSLRSVIERLAQPGTHYHALDYDMHLPLGTPRCPGCFWQGMPALVHSMRAAAVVTSGC